MNKPFNFKASFVVAALLVLPVAQAATISKGDFDTGMARISSQYKVEKAACASLAGNAKDVCVEEAKAKERVAHAELEYAYTAKSSDKNKLLEAKAESAYAIAKEKCDDKAGNDKDVCVKEAKAVEVKALADAKLGKQIGEAKAEATEDKRDADYKVSAEQCDALAGDAKASCVAAAKTKFGKY